MQSTFIRRVLLADALLSGAAGVLMIAGASVIAPIINLPSDLLLTAGFALMPWMLALLWLARSAEVSRPGVHGVIAVNIAWVLGSIAVLFIFAPSAFGYAFVIAQAVAVGVLTELQIIALKREPVAA